MWLLGSASPGLRGSNHMPELGVKSPKWPWPLVRILFRTAEGVASRWWVRGRLLRLRVWRRNQEASPGRWFLLPPTPDKKKVVSKSRMSESWPRQPWPGKRPTPRTAAMINQICWSHLSARALDWLRAERGGAFRNRSSGLWGDPVSPELNAWRGHWSSGWLSRLKLC